MNKKTLNVEGMSCEHCEKAVNKAVSGVDGVSNVSVSLAEKKVTFTHAKNVSLESIKEAIEEQGYDVI